MADTCHLGIVCNTINTKPVAYVVEVNIARLGDGPMKCNVAMSALDVTGKVVTVEGRAASAVKLSLVIYDPLFQPGNCHQRLESRAGRKLGLDSSIEQRLIRVT